MDDLLGSGSSILNGLRDQRSTLKVCTQCNYCKSHELQERKIYLKDMSTTQYQLSTVHNNVIVRAHTPSKGESVFFKEMVFLALLQASSYQGVSVDWHPHPDCLAVRHI